MTLFLYNDTPLQYPVFTTALSWTMTLSIYYDTVSFITTLSLYKDTLPLQRHAPNTKTLSLHNTLALNRHYSFTMALSHYKKCLNALISTYVNSEPAQGIMPPSLKPLRLNALLALWYTPNSNTPLALQFGSHVVVFPFRRIREIYLSFQVDPGTTERRKRSGK